MSKWDVARALKASDLPAPAKLIMWDLLDSADADTAAIPEQFTPSLTDLVRTTSQSRSTVAKWLNHLEDAGWVGRDRPDVAAARADGEKTRYRLMIPGSPAGGPPNIASSPGDGPPVVREADGGSPPNGRIPSPDHLDLDQSKAAAAANITDHRGEGETPTSGVRPGRARDAPTPDAARVVAGIPGAGRSWAADVQTALDAGHSTSTILDAVNAPITGEVRNEAAVRRARLRDLAGTPPDPGAFWADLRAEYPPPQPDPPPPEPQPPTVATGERSEETARMFAELRRRLPAGGG